MKPVRNLKIWIIYSQKIWIQQILSKVLWVLIQKISQSPFLIKMAHIHSRHSWIKEWKRNPINLLLRMMSTLLLAKSKRLFHPAIRRKIISNLLLKKPKSKLMSIHPSKKTKKSQLILKLRSQNRKPALHLLKNLKMSL